MSSKQASKLRLALLDGIYANRPLVMLGAMAGTLVSVALIMLGPYTDIISELRIWVYSVTTVLFLVLLFWMLLPKNSLTYPMMVGGCLITYLALLVILWDALFHVGSIATHRGAIPLEVTVIPLAILFNYAYLKPQTANILFAGYLLLGMLLGGVYFWLNLNRNPAELWPAFWTINSFMTLGALSAALSFLHIRHARQVGDSLQLRCAQVQDEVHSLRQRLYWDRATNCLNKDGLHYYLEQRTQSLEDDLVVGILQLRRHPPPGPKQQVPSTWQADLAEAVSLLNFRALKFEQLGWVSSTALVLWTEGNDAQALVDRIEKLLPRGGDSPAFYAAAKVVYQGSQREMISTSDLLDDLQSELFLHIHCQ